MLDPPLQAKDRRERAENALAAANEAAHTVSNLYITFLFLETYIGIIIASTIDEQLLWISPVTLPLLNVGIPIKVFYAIASWFVVLFHLNLMLQFRMLSDKLRRFLGMLVSLPAEQAECLRQQLVSFPYAQLIAGPKTAGVVNILFWLIVWVTLVFLPVGVLLSAQVRFLPYHHHEITFVQQLAVTADIVLLAFFWRGIIHRDTPSEPGPPGWRAYVTRQMDMLRVFVLNLAILAFSWWFATIPGEHKPWEEPPWMWLPGSWLGWFELRNLDLREKVLTGSNKLPAKVINALREGKGEQREQALQKVLGIDLQGRDLRYAELSNSILPKADLRRAQLQGADLGGAQLQGADLNRAQLQGAFLREAQLQGADLWGARIGGADFENANLDFTDLGNLDRKPLTKEAYQKLSQHLEHEIYDTGRRVLALAGLKMTLARLKTSIGKEDTLKKTTSAAQCLSGEPKPLTSCITNEADFSKALVSYLVKLACGDPDVARGVTRRAFGRKIFKSYEERRDHSISKSS